jgi:hypothetical protein
MFIRRSHAVAALLATVLLWGMGSVSAARAQIVAAVLPSSRAIAVGGTATAFATIINAGTSDATNCAIAPLANISAAFSYQTTDPTTNALTGTGNTPVTIPAGNLQTFVIALTSSAAFPTTSVAFGFTCDGLDPAPILSGINTLLLTASSSPTPDVIALAATVGGNGTVSLDGAPASGSFAVAITNLGASDNVTVTTNTGASTLPVSVAICQTDPTSSVCLQAPSTTITLGIGTNATATFGIFVTGTGDVAPLPGADRIFVQFADSNSTVVGSTSVAVNTAGYTPASAAAVSFSASTPSTGSVGQSYNFCYCNPTPSGANGLCGASGQVNPSGGYPPYTFQLGSGTGSPPAGISLLSNGCLSGAPSASGNFSFNICAIDLNGGQSCQPTSIPVAPTTEPLTITAAALGIPPGSGGGAGGGTVTDTTGFGVSCGNTANGGGYSYACTPGTYYPYGTVITLLETPLSGSAFVGWSGGTCSGTAPTCTVTMDSAIAVTATFNASSVTYETLTVSSNGSGTVTSNPPGISGTGSASFPQGTTVTVIESPYSGAAFTGWSGACSGSATTCSVTMSAAESVTATFSTSTGRNVLLQPFASDSIWNMPIGSGAVYQAANITAPPTSVFDDDDILIFTPTAPMTGVYENGAGWQYSSIDRCDFTTWPITSAGFSVPIPTNFVLPNEPGTPNNTGAVLLADGQTISQFSPLQRCTAGGPVTFTNEFGPLGSLAPNVSLYSGGIPGTHGALLSNLGGTIRLGELVPGNSPIVNGVNDVMRHALKLEFTGLFNSLGYGPFWPATNADGGNEGLLVALLPTFNYNGLQTAPGRSIAWTLINYGAYLVDDPGWNATGICMEKSTMTLDGTITSAVDQFQTNWGYPFYQYQTNAPWLQDMETIVANLQVITNNGPNSIGGGGTPRQPLLPPVTAPGN